MDDLNREANFAVCYNIPYDGKGDYNSQLFEYMNYLTSTILSYAKKIKEKKVLIAVDFLNNLKNQDKKRFF